MFSLTLERGRYLRIRKRVTEKEVVNAFRCPVHKVFCGEIIELPPPKRYCYALAGDTYKSIAEREGVNEEELCALNKNTAVYPTQKVWLP
ncbi:MAG: LysM peptidoglycan-binding domain-containing protein [Roseburia sp.]|nr:LysM peptidoglycan-binding domain-containing protein [Roseburia sp.]